MPLDPNQRLPKKRKSKLWLLLLLLFLIIALLVFLFLFYFQAKPVTNGNLNQNQNQIVLPEGSTGPLNNGNTAILTDLKAANGGDNTVKVDEQNNAILIATSFTERFGSFSNQGDYRNFAELDQFMTPKVKKWVVEYSETLKKQHADFNVYFATETKAISTVINSFDDAAGKSEILIKTQRQEFNNTTANPSVYYQDMLLNLVKIDGKWLVDGAYWQ